jgi:hypothetical protein
MRDWLKLARRFPITRYDTKRGKRASTARYSSSALLLDTRRECATFARHGYGTFWGCVMSFKQKAVLVGLTIALVSISACRQRLSREGPGQHHGQEQGRVFWIYVYTDSDHPDQCYVDWPVATLWKSKGQTVKWVSDDKREYTVDFTQGTNGSPFAQTKFDVPSNGVVPSGPLTQSGKYYDYAIRAGDANGKICKPPSDPGLNVKP